MCTCPQHIKLYKGTGFEREMTVPCGKCCECLRRKQNDYMQVFYTAAQQFRSMCFVTLTYKDSVLPLRCRMVRVSPVTGEISPVLFEGKEYPLDVEQLAEVYPQEPARVRNDYFDRCPVVKLKNGKTGHKYTSIITDGYDSLYMEVQASLRRRDVRLWLKRARVNYERKHGNKLPAFKYVCVGEYGSQTYRPHYHLAFFGLPVKIVNELCQDWNERFGFSLVKNVPIVSLNANHNDIEATAHYIAKYMTKGDFDCPTLKDGLQELPRVIISTKIVDYTSFLDYYRGTDNIIPSAYFPPTWYDKNQLDTILHRRFFVINGRRYTLGKHFITNIFTENEKITKLDGTTRYTRRSLPLQDAMRSRLLALSIERDNLAFSTFASQNTGHDVEAVEEFIFTRGLEKVERESAARKKLKEFYQKDSF